MLGLSNGLHCSSPPSEFLPDQISGLVAWYDFTDTSTVFVDDGSGGYNTVTNGGKISKITNKAYDGLGASSTSLATGLFQTTGANQPSWDEDGIGGKGAAHFNTTDYVLASTTLGNITTDKMSGYTMDADDVSMYWVFGADGTTITSSTDQIVFSMTNASRATAGVFCDASDDQIYFHFNSSNTIDTGTDWPEDNAPQAWTMISNGTNVRIFNNQGSAVVTDTTDYSSLDYDLTADSNKVKFSIGSGSDYASARSFRGKVAEVLVYDGAHTDANKNLVQAYLHTKYGL